MGNSNDLTRRFYGGGLRGSAVFFGRFLKIIGRFGNKKGTDLKMVVQNSFLMFKEHAYNHDHPSNGWFARPYKGQLPASA